MPGPFIFIATNRLKPEKLDDERRRVPGLVDFIQASEPRLIAFNEYANEEGTEVAVVQIHPDADSMVFHMELIAEHDVTPRQIALAWQLHHTANPLPVPGTTSVAHLHENLDAAGISLTQDEVDAITALAPEDG